MKTGSGEEWNVKKMAWCRQQCVCDDCPAILPAGQAAQTYYGRWDGMWYVARHCTRCAILFERAQTAAMDSGVDEDMGPSIGFLHEFIEQFNKDCEDPELRISVSMETQA